MSDDGSIATMLTPSELRDYFENVGSALSLFAMVLVRRNRGVLACVIGMLVNGGFLSAWMTRELYGGSMAGTSTAGAVVAGIDAAVRVVGGSFLGLALPGVIGTCRQRAMTR